MEKEQILTTKISLKGSFFECQLYSGRLYLWTEANQLMIYDWNKWMKALNQVERPVYFEPFPFEDLHITLADLEPYLERTLPFNEPPLATALFNHQLYFSDSTGFYVLSQQHLDDPIIKLWDVPVLNIAISKNGRFALACGAAGLYEYLVSKRFTQHSAPRIAENIYQLTDQFSSRSEWSQQDLIQFGFHPHREDFVFYFHLHQQKILLDRSVTASELLNQEQHSIEELPLPLAMTKPLIDEGELFSFEPLKRKLEKEKQYRSKSITVKAALSSLNQQPPHNLNTLYVHENKGELLVTLNEELILSVTSPFIKWRVYDRTLYYRNQLHLLMKDKALLYLFTELIR
ncbi:hypothetical protein ACWOFR_07570 [Carnobacterium gallinarum]|uniref:hypothetical protein n=1 Tax=Carnobacterium gallinarum TaxID=2749 RepID=UPI00068D7B7B|nr:hypothetical protein [Carnobacterium gallinarum]